MALFQEVQPFFSAIGDVSRQNIIKELMKAGGRPLSVNDIADKIKLSQPVTSHHLKILREVKVVNMNQSGTQRLYYLAARETPELFEPLKQLIALIEEKTRQ